MTDLNPGLADTLKGIEEEAAATRPVGMLTAQAISILIEEREERGILSADEAEELRRHIVIRRNRSWTTQSVADAQPEPEEPRPMRSNVTLDLEITHAENLTLDAQGIADKVGVLLTRYLAPVDSQLLATAKVQSAFIHRQVKTLAQRIPFKVMRWPTGEKGVAFSTYEVDGTRFFRVWIDDATPNQNIVALVESEFYVLNENGDLPASVTGIDGSAGWGR